MDRSSTFTCSDGMRALIVGAGRKVEPDNDLARPGGVTHGTTKPHEIVGRPPKLCEHVLRQRSVTWVDRRVAADNPLSQMLKVLGMRIAIEPTLSPILDRTAHTQEVGLHRWNAHGCEAAMKIHIE